MLKKRIVLVLGAGASKPYGFSLGRGLLDKAMASGREWLDGLLLELGHTESELAEFRRQLRKAAVGSIDEFLEHHPRFLAIGKHTIAALLLDEEREEALHADSDESWYRYFFGRINRDALLDREALNRIAVITYNYDRSLEQWLLDHLQYGRALERAAAIDVLLRLRIVHVHGSLGPLPGCGDAPVAYGERASAAALDRAGSSIQIVHEVSSDQFAKRPFDDAHKELQMASDVLFLGFGYLPANVRRLRLAGNCVNRDGGDPYENEKLAARGIRSHAKVLGTRLGFTDGETKQVHALFKNLGANIQFGPEDHGVLKWMRNAPTLFSLD